MTPIGRNVDGGLYMKVQTNAVRQDLLRGVRWGAILLIAALLSIATYRVFSSSPAVASQTASEAEAVEELAPAEPPVVVQAEPALKVGPTVLKGPDVPPAPEVTVRRKLAAKTAAVVVMPPERIPGPARFGPSPTPSKSSSNSFVGEALPDASATPPASGVEMPGPGTATSLAPPPEDSKGNRATRMVRSVGRIFRLGRKESDGKSAEPAKK